MKGKRLAYLHNHQTFLGSVLHHPKFSKKLILDRVHIVELIHLVRNLFTYVYKQNINKYVVSSLAPAGGHQAATGDVDTLKWMETVKLHYSNILLLLLLYFDISRNSSAVIAFI